MENTQFQNALNYLYSFVDYSLEKSYRYSSDVFDLRRVDDLLARLGDPHKKFQSVHIAGTKGKGSVSAMVESCFRSAGYSTGLYTSPHLEKFAERIRTNGEEIGEEDVADLVEKIKPHVAAVEGLTTFELITAIGFLYFAEKGIDFGIIEVGLGGRLDATNVIHPLVSVITSISYDHMHLLGDSLSDIAREKCGIIKPGIPVVSSPQQYEVEAVIREIAQERGSPLVLVGRDWHFSHGNHSLAGQQVYIWSSKEQPLMDEFIQSSGNMEWVPPRYEVSLLGYHQVINAATSYAILDLLKKDFPKITEDAIKKGFRTTSWPGRFDVISMDPIIVVDSAHNRDSALKLRIALDDYFPGQPVTLIFGASSDKDIPGMFSELLPRVKRILITHAEHPRATEVNELASLARGYGIRVEIIPKVPDALQYAIENVGIEEVILAAGSIFVAGEILSAWDKILQKRKIPT